MPRLGTFVAFALGSWSDKEGRACSHANSLSGRAAYRTKQARSGHAAYVARVAGSVAQAARCRACVDASEQHNKDRHRREEPGFHVDLV